MSEQVFLAVKSGSVVDLGDSGGGPVDALADDVDWGPQRQIPADVLLAALTDEPGVHARGVRIRGARITGEMAWDWQRLAAPLELTDCVIDAGITLDHAHVAGLTLVRCRVPGLSAQQLTSSSTLQFEGSRFQGTVTLRGADVDGDVLAEGAQVCGTIERDGERVAWYASRVKISGALSLSAGFSADGGVRLLGAQIGGNLVLQGGRFSNPGADALQSADADIAGSVILGTGFESTGRLFLSRTTVRGNFNADGAHLDGSGGDALKGDRIEIRGGLFMRAGFSSTGRIRLLGARIGGSLDCSGGTFEADCCEDAIWAASARIEGSVLLHQGFSAVGRVRLVDAEIGGSLLCDGASMVNPLGQAIRAINLSVSGDVSLDGLRAEGEVTLAAARIGGTVSARGATFRHPGGPALDFANAQIQGNLWLSEGLRAEGVVRLVRTRVAGDVSCVRSIFTEVFVARGMAAGGAFTWREIGSPLPVTIDLLRARVGLLDDDQPSWAARDGLWLDGFTYDRFSDRAPRSPQMRVAWVRRQTRFTPEPYQHLTDVYRRNGQSKEATVVAIAQQDDLRTRGDLSRPAKAWNWFLGRSIGHGYRPGRAAWGLLILYVVTLVSVWFGARSDAFVQVGNTAPQPSVTSSHCDRAYPCFSAPAYTLENITPILNLHQAENWSTRGSSTSNWVLRDWLYLTTVLGYGGTTLLAAGLSGVARRA